MFSTAIFFFNITALCYFKVLLQHFMWPLLPPHFYGMPPPPLTKENFFCMHLTRPLHLIKIEWSLINQFWCWRWDKRTNVKVKYWINYKLIYYKAVLRWNPSFLIVSFLGQDSSGLHTNPDFMIWQGDGKIISLNWDVL